MKLDDKFTELKGRIYLGGIDALVRLPIDQHRRDRRSGLNTATFVSGYPGSPLAGCRHLILTPHIAGVTRESNARVSMLIAEKVAAALDGTSANP